MLTMTFLWSWTTRRVTSEFPKTTATATVASEWIWMIYEVAVVFINRFRKFRENGTSENAKSFSHFLTFSDNCKIIKISRSHDIIHLQLGVYSWSRMRISIKIVSKSRSCGSRHGFRNSLERLSKTCWPMYRQPDSRPNYFGISLSYWWNLFLTGCATSCVT